MMSFLEKIQNVNNYKKNINRQKTIKNSDSNNSINAIDRDTVKNDIVTEIKICVSR